MKKRISHIKLIAVITLCIGIWFPVPHVADAHCDTLAGPVVMSAKTALEKGDVTSVLKWVKKEYEGEIKEAFKKTVAVRKQGREAKELADTYFFETLVRLHRAGEGAPYTGLKPGEAIEPIVSEADKSLESGSADNLIRLVTDAVTKGIRERFVHAKETKKYADDSIEKGRIFVEAYVEYTHYVERLYNDAAGKASHDKPEEVKSHPHHHH